MEKEIGKVSRGVCCPVIREGDDLAAIVSRGVLSITEAEGSELHGRDVIAVVEPIVARAQGNYTSVGAITADVRERLRGETIDVMLPTLSCNWFTICLKGIAKGVKKVVPMPSYPSDEIGSKLVSTDKLDEAGTSPYSGVLSLETYRKLFGENRHRLTGINYVSYYGNPARSHGAEVEIIFANHPRETFKYTKNVLTCGIHTGVRVKHVLKANGAEHVYGLDDIMTASVDGFGYNEASGLLGSNKSTEDIVRLLPRNCQPLVQDIQKQVLQACGKHMEIMVYDDGASEDPVGKIWEFADSCVSPAYTPELEGIPNELRLKYPTDNDLVQLKGGEPRKAIEMKVREKEDNPVGNAASQGTTPKRLTDSIDSLCDPTSGSGGKGTPIVLAQGYFDNFTN